MELQFEEEWKAATLTKIQYKKENTLMTIDSNSHFPTTPQKYENNL